MSQADDQLVAIADEYRRAHTNQAVKLLTLDSGPIVMAQMVGLENADVPDEWILKPEADARDKELNRLREELARFKKSEPSFVISATTLDSTESVDTIDLTEVCHAELSETERGSVLDDLRRSCPIETSFGPEVQEPRKSILGLGQIWQPASADDIEQYKASYANWLTDCESFFGELHMRLNRATSSLGAIVRAGNVGSRPARDALIEIEATGNFQLRVPFDADENDGSADETSLKPPPVPPRGKWVSAIISSDGKGRQLLRDYQLDALKNFDRQFTAPRIFSPELAISTGPKPRDPNAFYYKPDRPTMPTSIISLECAQWRHSTAPVDFFFEICVSPDENEAKGAIRVQIHAENLSDVAVKKFPVRISRVTKSNLEGALDSIKKMEGD